MNISMSLMLPHATNKAVPTDTIWDNAPTNTNNAISSIRFTSFYFMTLGLLFSYPTEAKQYHTGCDPVEPLSNPT